MGAWIASLEGTPEGARLAMILALSAALARIANRIHDLAIATAHDEQGTTP